MVNKIEGFMKIIMLLIIPTIVFLVIDYYFGAKIAMNLMATILLVMALLFTVKREYCIKYFNFANPSYMKRLGEKGEDFKRKNITTNIVGLYIISGATFLNASIQRGGQRLLTEGGYVTALKFISITVLLGITLFFLNNFILKKSKSNNTFIGFSVILGIILAVVLLVTIMFILM